MLNSLLERQIENNTIFHSYIIEGGIESVREQYLDFARIVFDTNVDVKNLIQVISPENNNISIDQIRILTKAVYEKPAKFKYNIFVIEDAHFMRVEAQNALLKTLEEIPSYSIVFMTTNNRYKFLNTIISRSQVIVISKKEDIDLEDELTKNVINLLTKSLEGNYYIINKEKNIIKELSEFKQETLYILTKIFSDALFKSNTQNIKYRNLLEKLSIFSIKSLETIILKIEKVKDLLKINFNFQIAIEDLIFTIIEELNKSNEIHKDK